MVRRLDTVYNNKLKIIVIDNLAEKRFVKNIGNSFIKNYIYFSIP
jgi:hypothetical protein